MQPQAVLARDVSHGVDEDAYRFPPVLSEFDLYLLSEGTHVHLYEKLGAHPMTMEGVAGRRLLGVRFAARPSEVSVVGDFKFWDEPPACPCGCAATAIWEIFVPRSARRRPLQVLRSSGWWAGCLPLKSDPVAFAAPGAAARKRPPLVVDLDAIKRTRSQRGHGVQCALRAGLDLRSPSRLLAAAA